MKKSLIQIVFLLTLLNVHVIAQPTIQWEKSLGGTLTDVGNSIVQANDYGFVIAGFVLSNDGDINDNHGIKNNWVVKLNFGGLIQWPYWATANH